MSGKRSRTKGHSFERWCANKFKKFFPNARRHLEYHSADANGIDLVDTGSFRVQCKRSKNYASFNMIKQVEIDPIEGGIPLLISKADRCEPMVAMYFDDFLRLLSENRASRYQNTASGSQKRP